MPVARHILGLLIRKRLLVLAAVCCLPAAARCSAGCLGGGCRVDAGTLGVPHPAVVRIVNAARDGRYYGSGTLVRKDRRRGIVLTCAHLFRNGTGKITVTFPDGRRFAADLTAVDRRWDLAALSIAPPDARPVAIAEKPPQPGDRLQSCGYGPDGCYRCNRGYARGYVRVAGTSSCETLELSGTARGGDSGGPVFNAQGRLAAVLWGTDGRIVGGTYCGRIRKFLGGILRLPQHAGNQPPGQTPGQTPDRPPTGTKQLGTRLDQIRGRLDRIERAVDVVAALRQRVERAEATVGQKNLRAAVRQVAADVLAERAPQAPQAWLPGLVAAVGWTGPPSIAAILALKLAATILRRRAGRRRAARRKQPVADPYDPAAKTRAPQQAPPLNDDYAKQLAGVYSLSGRSPTADATLGREYDEQLRKAQQSSDAALARWARELREQVAKRFYRIHSSSPLPAEPVGGE